MGGQVSRLQHPFVMPYKEHWLHHGHTLHVVYGYCEKGDLGTAITKQRVRQLCVRGGGAAAAAACTWHSGVEARAACMQLAACTVRPAAAHQNPWAIWGSAEIRST